MKLAWGSKVDEEFRQKVISICKELGWPPDPHASWLMSCMAFETGETFSPSIRNAAGSGATGLIQFMPFTAHSLGTSSSKLAVMTAVQQLDYVKLYFKPYARRIHSLSDMYMGILMPAYVGRADDSVLFVSPNISYRQNAGLDSNKDGYVTKHEACRKVLDKYQKGLREPYCIKI